MGDGRNPGHWLPMLDNEDALRGNVVEQLQALPPKIADAQHLHKLECTNNCTFCQKCGRVPLGR